MLGERWFAGRLSREHDPLHTAVSVPFDDPEVDRRGRVLVLSIGLDTDILGPTVRGLTSRLRSRGREPIFVIDSPCFELFRGQGLVVEVLPPPGMLGEIDRRRYELYISGKLESIRESWLISEEVCIGSPVEALYQGLPLDPVDPITQGHSDTHRTD